MGGLPLSFAMSQPDINVKREQSAKLASLKINDAELHERLTVLEPDSMVAHATLREGIQPNSMSLDSIYACVYPSEKQEAVAAEDASEGRPVWVKHRTETQMVIAEWEDLTAFCKRQEIATDDTTLGQTLAEYGIDAISMPLSIEHMGGDQYVDQSG
jgi:hypothetical protein